MNLTVMQTILFDVSIDTTVLEHTLYASWCEYECIHTTKSTLKIWSCLSWLVFGLTFALSEPKIEYVVKNVEQERAWRRG